MSRLRATEAAIFDGEDAEERRAFIKMVADEIENLRGQIKALVHEWELSERGVHCEHKEVRDEI